MGFLATKYFSVLSLCSSVGFRTGLNSGVMTVVLFQWVFHLVRNIVLDFSKYDTGMIVISVQ